MTESIYKEYENKYYNPNDNDKRPGDNDNWKSIQEGFYRIGSTQLETSAGLTLGKGTEDETSVTAGELEEIKNPSQLETSGGLTLGKGTADEVSVTAAELATMKRGVVMKYIGSTTERLNVSANGNSALTFSSDVLNALNEFISAHGRTFINLYYTGERLATIATLMANGSPVNTVNAPLGTQTLQALVYNFSSSAWTNIEFTIHVVAYSLN